MCYVYVSRMKRCRGALWKILENASREDPQSNPSDTQSAFKVEWLWELITSF